MTIQTTTPNCTCSGPMKMQINAPNTPIVDEEPPILGPRRLAVCIVVARLHPTLVVAYREQIVYSRSPWGWRRGSMRLGIYCNIEGSVFFFLGGGIKILIKGYPREKWLNQGNRSYQHFGPCGRSLLGHILRFCKTCKRCLHFTLVAVYDWAATKVPPSSLSAN